MRVRPGDAVRIRDQRWRVAAESSFGTVSIVDVDGCDATNHGTKARFLLPFEAVAPASPSAASSRFVTIDRWRRAARAVLAAAVPRWTSLRAARGAQFTVLPFQLEPAMAVVRGEACRVLIADEVGLGKTVQAGLILAEMIVRSADTRALIVAPAGLREQWRDELQSRFQLRAEVLDTQSIARIAAEVVADVNPWSINTIAITSIDFIKRPEVMRSLETLTWDVLVFDEAHALAGRSDRAAAAAALGRRARVVVMLTATPHSGDEDAFARLAAVGDIDSTFPLMTFRRARSDVGLPRNRRSAVLRVRPTTDEVAMHHALEDYLRRLAREVPARVAATSLLSSILLRRACSSATSLARSIERRMALLFAVGNEAAEQLMLPYATGDSDEEPALELGVAGLSDPREEQRWLQHVATLAKTATAHESKVRALLRLLRRIDEPTIVFTEYRDTLEHIAEKLHAFVPLTLHGGLTSRERADVVAQFNGGQTRLLLATDAASEGLNLHRRCRFVVNLEVPWTPVRLEQRVGRVNRIGQARRVHVLNLSAVGTHDEVMAQQLWTRGERITAALNAPAPNCGLQDDAAAEAARVISARQLSREPSPGAPRTSALLTSVRLPHRHATEVRAFHLTFVDEDGRLEFETIAGVVADSQLLHLESRAQIAARLQQQRALAAVMMDVTPWLELSRRRERAIADALRHRHARLSAELLQPGLFDRRAERVAAAQTARVEQALARSRDRLDALARLQRLRCGDNRLLLGIRFLA
jgi:superfamily II DNA or RNA helicase